VKVLLTGAAGFIGSHVARELVHRNHEVHALVRPQSELLRIADIEPSLHIIRGDVVASSFVLPQASFDCCIHLAWYVEPGKYLHAPENKQWVEASLRLARMLKENGCRRFVATGTCFEYAPSDPPQHELSPVRPSTPYVRAKLELFDALQTIGIETAWLRFFYQYGPNEDPRRLVPVVIKSLLRNQEMKLVPGDRVRDYLYIEDVASAVGAVAGSRLTGAINIGSGTPVTVRELASKIGEALHRVELLKFGALPYAADEPQDLLADITKLREGTGWQPRHNLEDGLRQTIEWWKSR
jgi:nucleoside-diphosphate-sugar epimerase